MTATCSPVEKDEPPEGDAKQKQWSTTARRGEHISNRRRKGANEDTEDDVLDLISHVHLKLTIPLESRLRDVQAATYYTLFSRKCSAIVTEMAKRRQGL